MVKQVAQALRSGSSFNHTKFYNQLSVKIGFPTATGFPFVFSYNIPTLMYFGGEAKLRTNPELVSNNEIRIPNILNATAEIQAL